MKHNQEKAVSSSKDSIVCQCLSKTEKKPAICEKLEIDQEPIYITFDDGPKPRATDTVLDVLKELCLKATFFLNGIHMSNSKKEQHRLTRDLLNSGHTIATHGYDHNPESRNQYHESSPNAVKGDYTDNDQYFRDLFTAYGDSFPGFEMARLPGDGKTFANYVRMITSELKLAHIGWHFEFAPIGTFKKRLNTPWQGLQSVGGERAEYPKAQSIILMHDHHWIGKGKELKALFLKLMEERRLLPLRRVDLQSVQRNQKSRALIPADQITLP